MSTKKQKLALETEKNLQKLPDEKQNNIRRELTESEKKDFERLIVAIESSGLDEFMEYIRSPWKMLWPNFVAGVARGVGALIGAALVIAIIGWILTQMISLPLIGAKLEPYITEIQEEITRYTESTNYSKNFQNLEKTMLEIRDELKVQNNFIR